MQRLSQCALILSFLAILGCEKSDAQPQPTGGKKLKVVCTTTMIADLARNICGDLAEIQGIMKAGEDPHVYEVRPKDAQTIAAADVVLMNGFHLEATLGKIVEQHAKGAVAELAEEAGIKPLSSETVAGAPDPHCWFNVQHFRKYTEVARDVLAKADPTHADEYRRRANAYVAELADLDSWVRQQLATIPRAQRAMVTSHDAFQYYGQNYDIDVFAVIGISTEQQPRPQDIERLMALVRERKVKALFIETSVSKTLNDLVRKVAAATGARIGGTLYSDSLAEPGHAAGTYIGMVRHNTTTIVEALK